MIHLATMTMMIIVRIVRLSDEHKDAQQLDYVDQEVLAYNKPSEFKVTHQAQRYSRSLLCFEFGHRTYVRRHGHHHKK